MRSRALAMGLATLAIAACERDVIVGEVPGASSGSIAGDVSGLTAVALSGDQLLVAGYEGGETGLEATSDLWLGRLRTDVTEIGGARLDVGGGADVARAVLAYAATDSIAAGTVTTAAGRRAWVRRRGAGDGEVWTRLLEPVGGSTSSDARGLANGRSGTIVVCGIDTTDAGIEDGWAARLDASGAVVWKSSGRAALTSPFDTPLYTVAVNGLDQVFVGGTRRVVQQDGSVLALPVILKVDPEGRFSNSSTGLGGAAAQGAVRGIIPEDQNQSQQTFVCMDAGGAVVIQHLDVSFVSIGRQSLTDPRGAITLGGCVAASDGTILLAGSVATGAGPEAWAAKVERPGLGVRWQRAIPSPRPVSALALAADGAGGGWAVGSTASPVRRWASPIAP